jgi:hypothetical protein
MSTTLIEREHERVEEVRREVTERDVLLRAADLLGEFGWCTGIGGMPGTQNGTRGPLCYLGSVAQAGLDLGRVARPSGTYDGDWDYAYATELLGLRAPARGFLWNDAPGRTKEEVVTALREAAARA